MKKHKPLTESQRKQMGERLKNWLKILGDTSGEFAVRIQANPSVVSRWLNGHVAPSPRFLEKLVATGLSEQYLYYGVGEPAAMAAVREPAPEDGSGALVVLVKKFISFNIVFEHAGVKRAETYNPDEIAVLNLVYEELDGSRTMVIANR